MAEIRSVGVVGAGQMGNGIAHVFALAGYDVLLNDIAQASLDKALSTIERNLDRQVTRGKITAEEKAAALAAPAEGGERNLGQVVVALGPPAEQGIWLSSPLVTEVAQGRIVTAAGKSLAVELRPGTGGALLSLAAFQALGLSLTELPQVTVYGP